MNFLCLKGRAQGLPELLGAPQVSVIANAVSRLTSAVCFLIVLFIRKEIKQRTNDKKKIVLISQFP